jgi:hypothetical protein
MAARPFLFTSGDILCSRLVHFYIVKNTNAIETLQTGLRFRGGGRVNPLRIANAIETIRSRHCSSVYASCEPPQNRQCD